MGQGSERGRTGRRRGTPGIATVTQIVLFLIYLAPTIYRMEERIRRAMPGLEVEINTSVDDIVLRIFDRDGIIDMVRL